MCVDGVRIDWGGCVCGERDWVRVCRERGVSVCRDWGVGVEG